MFYGSKSKTKTKPKQQPQRSPRIIGLGLIKLDFYLNLTDDQIKQFKIDFSKINSPKDLAFIAEEPALLDLIQISSSDSLSNILLYLNKVSIQKSFVELITLSPLRIHPDEEHMKKIFTHVTEHNYLFSNEMSVTSVPNKISFAFKNGKKLLKYFDITTDYDSYCDDILLDDSKKLGDDRLNNVYSNLMNSSASKIKNEVKENQSYSQNLKNKLDDKSKKNQHELNEEDDILVKDDIYNDMSNHLEISKNTEHNNNNNNRRLFDDEVNYKINEVNDEEEAFSNQNNSIRKTRSRKSNNLNDKEVNIENENSNRILNEENEMEMEEKVDENAEELDHFNKSKNSDKKSKLTNKTKSNKENQSINQGEELLENKEDQADEGMEEEKNEDEVIEKSEKASNVGSKILKTKSVNKEITENNENQEIANKKEDEDEDEEEDFNVEDIEEIKDENLNSSHLKTQSKKKEITQQSQRSELDLEQNKSKHSSYKFQEPYEKKLSNKVSEGDKNTKNSKHENNNFYTNNDKSISRKLDSISYGNNEDIKKNIRPLYEGLEINKNDKSTISGSKLVNIPAACEIEEYDFLFLDLEEFINFHTNGFHLSELAEFMKKISSNEKKPRIVLNYPNILINLNVVNLELLETIMAIMSYTDIFLFEKKECLAFFNMLNQMNYEKDLSDKQLMDYFFKEIPHQKASVNKLGLFLDELQKFTIAEQKKDKIIYNLTYEINLHPKINHFNQKIVDEYKKIMTINNSYFKSIFFGGYFSSYIFNEDHYISYFTGAESTKRILEIFKNKIDFPTNPEFYLVKLHKNKIIKDQQKEKLKQKEEKFVLDCVNKTNSTIRSYNPLFDDNLNAFFASGVIRKQLKDKGFINTNGFVLYDSSYKNIVGAAPKAKKRLDTSERERHLLLAIKHNKDLLSTDLENFSKSLKGQSPTNRKLPLPNFEMNSSNLYISSKIKDLKTSKKKLKPINTKIENTKATNERSLDNNKTSSKSRSPKGNIKELTTSKINNNKTQSIINQSSTFNNKQKQASNIINNSSSEVLNTSLLNKDQEDNYKYKEQRKISSRDESDYEANSDNDHAMSNNSKNKSKTHTISMNNQRYTEQSKNVIDESKAGTKRDMDESKSKQITENDNKDMQEDLNFDNNIEDLDDKNNDNLEKSKAAKNEENIEAENADMNNFNNEQDNKREKVEGQNEENAENVENDKGNNENNEVKENDEESNERKQTENNNLEKFESKMESEQEENMENENENLNDNAGEAQENKEEEMNEAVEAVEAVEAN